MKLSAEGIKKSLGFRAEWDSFSDSIKQTIPQDWFFKTFIPDWKIEKEVKGKVYSEDNYDCEDFALSAVAFMSDSFLRQPISPAFGRMVVHFSEPLLGIEPTRDKSHVTNLALTDKDGKLEWIAFEPITNHHMPLDRNYPGSIVRIML